MPLKKYSDELKKFIAENVEGLTTKQLVELVNAEYGADFTESKMKSYKANHNLKSGTPVGLPSGRPTELYPEEIRKFIEANYHGVGHKSMAELLNKTFNKNYTQMQMKSYYGRFKLDSGLTGQFSKGHVPANKGKKGEGGWEPTQFKKGNKPANWVPIGSERVNADGYTEIKIQDGKLQKNWKGKHILIWEKENGPIPKGHAAIFGDGNNRNFDINNLILVSRAQLLQLNRSNLIQKDADLTRSAVLVADICLKISDRKKKSLQKKSEDPIFPKPTHKKRPKPKVIKIQLQDKRECWVCKTILALEKHHILGGANRPLSELYGLYIYLCHNHHNENIPGDPGYHHNKKLRQEIQAIARKKFEDIYGKEAFLRIFKGVNSYT